MSKNLQRAPRFALLGCFGEHNIGDEALLCGGIELLRRRWPEATFTVFSDNPADTSATYGVTAVPGVGFLNLKVLPGLIANKKLFDIVRTVKNSDCLVVSGGELLRTDFGAKAVLAFFDKIMLSRLFSKPVVMLGVGVGEMDPGPALRVMRWASDGVPIVTREAESAQLLLDAGIGVPSCGIDLAYLVPGVKHGIALGGHPRLAVCLRDPAGTKSCRSMKTSREEFVQGTAAFCDHAIELGCNVVFVPFCRSESDDDLRFHVEVSRLMKHGDEAIQVDQYLTAPQAKRLIAEMDYVLGMRLHSCIFGFAAARPVLGLSYDPKVRKQFQSFGAEDFCLDLHDIARAKVLLERMMAAPVADSLNRKLEMHLAQMDEVLDGVFGKTAAG